MLFAGVYFFVAEDVPRIRVEDDNRHYHGPCDTRLTIVSLEHLGESVSSTSPLLVKVL